MFFKRKYFAAATLLGMSLILGTGCDSQYYTTDVCTSDTTKDCSNTAPAVNDVLMRDSQDKSSQNNALTTEEDQFWFTLDGSHPVYPFNFAVVRFNKLVDGATLENTERDALTGRQLGDCTMVAGDPVKFLEAGTQIPAQPSNGSYGLLSCYSPSDRTLEIRPLGSNGTAKPFLKYKTAYEIDVTNQIKDEEHGAPMSPQSITFNVGPFEVMDVTSGDGNDNTQSLLFASPNAPALAAAASPTTTEDLALQIRILFSGSMCTNNGKGKCTSGKAISQLLNAKLFDDAGAELSDTMPDPDDATGKKMVTVGTLISPLNPDDSIASNDARVVLVQPPKFITSQGMSGLTPGTYHLVLPPTVTDDGTVLGDAAGPVPAPLTIADPGQGCPSFAAPGSLCVNIKVTPKAAAR